MRQATLTLLAILAAACCATPSLALDVPAFTSSVTDLSGTLSRADHSRLQASIAEYRRESSVEIGVLIIPSLEDESLEIFAHDVFVKWGIGKSNDNGVLFLVAMQEHQSRIEVGYGLEGALTDVEAGRIVSKRSPMAQRFRKRDFGGGVQSVIDGIKRAIAGDYEVMPEEESNAESLSPLIILIIFIILALIMRFRARNQYRQGGMWTHGTLGSGGFGGGSFGGGSSGGGGFTFGGGSSGGGGASGGW